MPEQHFELSKLHGLGNDFLVVLAERQATPLQPSSRLAVRWADRHRGIGADGVIWALPGTDGADLVMVLHNADGSEAEISGNGIRCLAHAVARSRGVDSTTIVVDTAGGRRSLVVTGGTSIEASVTVDMGAVTAGPDFTAADVRLAFGEVGLAPPDDLAVASRSIGNPHIVLLSADPEVDIATVGAEIDRRIEGGANVHHVRRDGAAHLVLTHWERGAGVTQACGSGASVAAAVVAEADGVAVPITVTMPGGEAVVEPTGDTVILRGPSVVIADCEVIAETHAPGRAPGDGGGRSD